jgi:hypothetical protein
MLKLHYKEIGQIKEEVHEKYYPYVSKIILKEESPTIFFNQKDIKTHNDKLQILEQTNILPDNILNGTYKKEDIDNFDKNQLKFLFQINKINFNAKSNVALLRSTLKGFIQNNKNYYNYSTDENIDNNLIFDIDLDKIFNIKENVILKKEIKEPHLINLKNLKIDETNISIDEKEIKIKEEILEIEDEEEIINEKKIIYHNISSLNNLNITDEHNILIKRIGNIELNYFDYCSILKNRYVSDNIVESFYTLMKFNNVTTILLFQMVEKKNKNEYYKYQNNKFENNDIVLVPIIHNSHYYLLHFNIKINTIHIIDSIPKDKKQYLEKLKNILDYLNNKHEKKINKINNNNNNKDLEIVDQKIIIQPSPKQEDGINCSIFLLANSIVLKENDFNVKCIKSDLYTKDRIIKLRTHIKDILFNDIELNISNFIKNHDFIYNNETIENNNKRTIETPKDKPNKKSKTSDFIKTFHLGMEINKYVINGLNLEEMKHIIRTYELEKKKDLKFNQLINQKNSKKEIKDELIKYFETNSYENLGNKIVNLNKIEKFKKIENNNGDSHVTLLDEEVNTFNNSKNN